MAEQAYAYVTLIPVAKGFQKEVANQLKGTGGAGGTAGKAAGNNFKSSFGGALKGLAAIAGGALAAAGVGRFVSSSISQASDLGESLNAVSVVFEDSAQGINKLGEAASDSLGLSQTEFNSAAVQFSSFASKIAGDGGDVVGTIDDLTTRGADFASVMNLEVSDALAVFQSGLAGETEPLKKFGIDLSAAAVETFAYSNGIAEAGTALTETEKVQARYGLLLEQTEKTSGDFANTSDSLANSQRILKANFADVQAEVGNALVPALASLSTAMIPVVQQLAPVLAETFEALSPVITEIAGLLPELLLSFTPLIPAIGEVAKGFLTIVSAVLPPFINLINLLLPAILSLVPIFVQLITDVIVPMIPFVVDLVNQMLPLVMQIFPVLLQLATTLLPILLQLLQSIFVPLIPVITDVVSALAPMIEQSLPFLQDILENFVIPALLWLADTFGNILVGAITGVMGFFGMLNDTITNVGNFFTMLWTEHINPFIQQAGEWFQWLYDTIIHPIFRGAMIIVGLFAAAWQFAYDNIIKPVIDFFADAFTRLYELTIVPISDFITGAFESLATAWDSTYQNVIKPMLDMFGDAYQWVFDNVITPVSDMIEDAFTTVGETTEDIFTNLKNFFEDTFANIVNIVREPLNKIIGFVNFVIDAINSISVTIPDWVPEVGGETFGINLPKVATIPAMAKGGFVDSPTMAMIGEAGPEVVMPLNRFENMMGLDQGGKTVNYYAAPNQSLDSEQQLFTAMRRAKVVANW